MLTWEQQQAANVARLRLLAEDANENSVKFAQLYTDPSDDVSAKYYTGFRDGLNRAIDVLEGRG